MKPLFLKEDKTDQVTWPVTYNSLVNSDLNYEELVEMLENILKNPGEMAFAILKERKNRQNDNEEYENFNVGDYVRFSPLCRNQYNYPDVTKVVSITSKGIETALYPKVFFKPQELIRLEL